MRRASGRSTISGSTSAPNRVRKWRRPGFVCSPSATRTARATRLGGAQVSGVAAANRAAALAVAEIIRRSPGRGAAGSVSLAWVAQSEFGNRGLFRMLETLQPDRLIGSAPAAVARRRSGWRDWPSWWRAAHRGRRHDVRRAAGCHPDDGAEDGGEQMAAPPSGRVERHRPALRECSGALREDARRNGRCARC